MGFTNTLLEMASHYLNLTTKEMERFLGSDLSVGLKEEEARSRLAISGPNDLGKPRSFSYIKSLLGELKSPLVLVLVVAGLLSLFLRDYVDLIVISIALFINLLIGLIQEKRADDSFLKLSTSQEKFATVLRGGKKRIVDAKSIVKGDVVYLEVGMLVPADIRILEENDLKIEESVLTGEWSAVSKESAVGEVGAPVSRQRNMAFMGTSVVNGSGVGMVVKTGKYTEVGKIASSLSNIRVVHTPLERNIKKIGHLIFYFAIAASAAIFVLGLLQDKDLIEIFKTAVAIAVSVVPEGLPAAVTVVLAIGMEKILKKGGLVKNLMAAETLGSTTVILTDKTGTLTEGKMKLVAVHTLEESLSSFLNIEERGDVLKAAVLASDAFIEESSKEESGFVINGRPVEKAIVGAGLEAGLSQRELNNRGEKRLHFLAFDSKRRYMASLNETGKWPNRIYFSGEPEKILSSAASVYRKGETHKMSSEWKEILLRTLKSKTAKGLRLTAVCYRDVPWKKIPDDQEILENTVFLGFLAFTDPVRKDVNSSIDLARSAGIKVLMVTGDYPDTALEVAKAAGITKGNSPVITGDDVDNLKDAELYGLLRHTPVFARVLPEQKLRISQVLRDYGEVVAMTGDGVNDAPALRSADIGIAVSSGTEVAKGASDLVLIDNSFTVIINAVEEGRRIVDNLRKIVGYLLATSFGEVLLILFALTYGLPLPILPAQILWLNVLGEGFMNFAFAFEDKEEGVMKRPPVRMENGVGGIISSETKKMIIIACAVLSVFLFSLYFIFLSLDLSIDEIRTLMFVAISISAIFFSFSFKNLREPIWNIAIWNNRYFLGAISLSALGLILSFILTPLKVVLSLTAISQSYIFILVVFALLNLLAIEILKTLFITRQASK